MEIRAVPLADPTGFALEPAPHERPWMDATNGKFAYRCLPLTIANQAGWVVRAPFTFQIFWNDHPDQPAGRTLFMRAENPEEAAPWAPWIGERFPGGILSIKLPYRFETDPGYGLVTRGPTNYFVHGATPLESFVDTSAGGAELWMDWKLLEPGRAIAFRKGEPLAMISPYPLDLLEAVTPRVLSLSDNKALQEAHDLWSERRGAFIARDDRSPEEWQKDYFQGRNMAGERQHAHKTRLRLKPFA